MSSAHVFIEKLHLRNFRSVRRETITFDNPLFLVGRNGAGKSNVVDAFAFLADCMEIPLTAAVNRRGGPYAMTYRRFLNVDSVRFAMRVEFSAKQDELIGGVYSIDLGFSPHGHLGTLEVLREQLKTVSRTGKPFWFDRSPGLFESNVEGLRPSVEPEALALPIVGGIQAFAPVHKALSEMRVYAIDPKRIREERDFQVSRFLEPDGSNVTATLLATKNKAAARRVTELLRGIYPELASVTAKKVADANEVVLSFSPQRASSVEAPPFFGPSQTSDGTLRALGLIVAALQDPAPSLIVIEEPEQHLHPGALGAIADLIQMASERTQVIVTTHSPDLLDAKWIKPENLRVVTWDNDATRVSELGIAPKRALQEHLMYAGQLMRANGLDAAPPSETASDTTATDDLFDSIPA